MLRYPTPPFDPRLDGFGDDGPLCTFLGRHTGYSLCITNRNYSDT